MDAPTLARGPSQGMPKQTSHTASSTSPPPAYSPRTLSGPQLLAQVQQAQAGTASNQMDSPCMIGHPPLTTVLDELDEDDEDFSEGASPICLRINTSIVVSKDNNLICLSHTPASQANAIAKAVVQAIHENSSGQCGIPMIDEEGRPRPVKIEVDAGISVDGANNVIGSPDIINKIINARKRSRTQDDGERVGEEHAEPAPRRPCRRDNDD